MAAGVLGFDLSPSLCGWAFAGQDGTLLADAWALPPLSPDLGGIALVLEQNVETLIARFQPAAIAYEAPLLLKHDTLLKLRCTYGIGVVLELLATKHGIPCQEMDPKRIKKVMTDDAYAEKKAVVAAARLLGVALPPSKAAGAEDAADAVGCAIIALSILDPAAASPHLATLRGSLL